MSFNMKLGADHDIIVGRTVARTEKLEYTAQLVKCRLLTFLGEWELDPNLGLPWVGVLDRSYDISAMKFAVRNTIQSTTGVKSVDSLSLRADTNTRLLTVSFTATSVYGQISTEVTV